MYYKISLNFKVINFMKGGGGDQNLGLVFIG